MFRSLRPATASICRIGYAPQPIALARVSGSRIVQSRTAPGISNQPGVRYISQSYLAKQEQAAQEFSEVAEKIRKGEAKNVWDVFNERGLIKDVAGRESTVKELLRVKRVGAYAGFDPTAPSLHIGHLMSMMPLFWFYFHGYPTVSLIGGATARIGDPIGRLKSRPLISNSDVARNITKVHYQIERIWGNVEELGRKYNYPGHWAGRHFLWNNNMWLNKLPFYDLLKRSGRHIRIGTMLAKESVKKKMESGDGMSFSEFSYPLMQGWDFWHMYSKIGVQLQVGGSDQYGNITMGCEILKTIRETEEADYAKLPGGWSNDPYGFTVPLLTDAAGNKFGKSEGNAVWLDPLETSAFDLYGYFVQRSDEEVQRLLTALTFMPLNMIESLIKRHKENPSERVAQHTLAFEVTSMVHGAGIAVREQRQHRAMFGKGSIIMPEGIIPKSLERRIADGTPIELSETDANFSHQATVELPRDLLMGKSIAKIVYACGLCESASAAQRLIQAGGLYVAAAPGQMTTMAPGSLDWTPVSNWFPEDTAKFMIDKKLLILRRGRRNIRIIEMVEDEKWKQSGQTYPGEPYTGKLRTVLTTMRDEALKKGKEKSNTELRKQLLAEMAKEGNLSLHEKVTVPNNSNIEFPPDNGEDRWVTQIKERTATQKERMKGRKTKGQRGEDD
ncbi:tyrosyl-tRNA synthetase [Ceratocystis pirilliformis]|uniref:Tyrosine--tRNA ligase n=1 Tax=Ceratocystis pirilliformis TaxID=259994 RepID=A0ABR3YLP4_9PEZI